MSEDIIVKADNGLTKVEDIAAAKAGEVSSLVQNVVTHLNALLAAAYGDVKVGFGAVNSGIGGTANLVVSTEALLNAAKTQTAEPLATPPAA